MASHELNLRIATIENDIAALGGQLDTLTKTIEEAMKLFSHAESSEQIALTEKRFQSNLANTEGIQSRYSRTEYATRRIAS